MDIIVILDYLFIIGMLVFGIGLGKLILDGAVTILVVVILCIICIALIRKYPVATLICLLVVDVIALGGIYILKKHQENIIPVTISRATETCWVYDTDGNTMEIPKGSIIARYTDENERKSEGSYYGFANHCYWYYNGEINHFFASSKWENPSEIVIKYYGDKKNTWYVVKIAEITYKEFSNSQWWHLAE